MGCIWGYFPDVVQGCGGCAHSLRVPPKADHPIGIASIFFRIPSAPAPSRKRSNFAHLPSNAIYREQFDERLRGALNPHPERPRAIYSLSSAAQWFAPFGRSGTQTFYADEPGVQVLKEKLKLTPVARGANVVLHVPKDESLFDDAGEPGPSVFCTGPIVTCLDLWAGNEREREAAEHLAGEFFPWLK